jgi:hypothetical protein
VDSEPDTLVLLVRQCASRSRDILGAEVERVDPRGMLGGEGRKPTFAAADVEHTLAIEAD